MSGKRDLIARMLPRGIPFQWRQLNCKSESRFVGFDTFEGVPEDWGKDHPKGTFSTRGQIPDIGDARVSFIKGLFQDKLRPFMATADLDRRLVVNVDCDIFSATLFVLGTLDRYFSCRDDLHFRRFLFHER
jgi:O-methyltransferase